MTNIDLLQGLRTGVAIKAAVRTLASSNVVLNGLQTVAGVSLQDGESAYLNAQDDPTENGIWVASTGPWSRRADADSSVDFNGDFLLLAMGGANQGLYRVVVADDFELNTDVLTASGIGSLIVGFQMPDGTISLPGLAFANEPDLGLRRVSSGVLAISEGSQDRVTVNGARVHIGPDLGSSFVLGLATTGSGLISGRFNNNATGNILRLIKSRSSVPGTFGTIVQNSDQLAVMQFAGDDGVDGDTIGAEIRAVITSAPAANRLPTAIQFFTSAGSADDDLALAMSLLGNGQQLALAGSAALPSRAYTTNLTSGDYSPGGNALGRCTNGLERMRNDSSGRTILANDNPAAISVAGVGGNILQTVIKTGDAVSPGMNMARFIADNSSIQINAGKSRGTTVGTFTALSAGDEILSLNAAGADGTDLATVAARMVLKVPAGASITTDRVPGDIELHTAAGAANNDIAAKLLVKSDGRILATAIHANAAGLGGIAQDILGGSDTYTPTLVNVSGFSAITSRAALVTRTGRYITVWGGFTATTTGTATNSIRIPLPVASNFTTSLQLFGLGASDASGNNPVFISGDATNDVALFVVVVSGAGAATNFNYCFRYILL